MLIYTRVLKIPLIFKIIAKLKTYPQERRHPIYNWENTSWKGKNGLNTSPNPNLIKTHLL